MYLTIGTGLSGTPMPYQGGSLESSKIWALVHFLDSLVPPAHRLSRSQYLGEEGRARMMMHMGRMMGPGTMMHPMHGTR